MGSTGQRLPYGNGSFPFLSVGDALLLVQGVQQSILFVGVSLFELFYGVGS